VTKSQGISIEKLHGGQKRIIFSLIKRRMGSHVRFFQRNWGVLKRYVIEGVKKFFKDGSMPKEIHETVIVLIQKKKS
jgi:predicted DNA-binding transcriptional regulator